MQKLFPSQQPNETIFLAVREHWILLALRIGIWFIFVAILIAFYSYAPKNLPGLFEDNFKLFVNLITYVYLIFLSFGLFAIIVIYYLNIHIVSDERIVDIDQTGIFSHVISELNIDKIEDVTSDTTGVLGTLFDFGTVYVQTAGARERFEFQNVPRPSKIASLILDIYEKQPGEKKIEPSTHNPINHEV